MDRYAIHAPASFALVTLREIKLKHIVNNHVVMNTYVCWCPLVILIRCECNIAGKSRHNDDWVHPSQHIQSICPKRTSVVQGVYQCLWTQSTESSIVIKITTETTTQTQWIPLWTVLRYTVSSATFIDKRFADYIHIIALFNIFQKHSEHCETEHSSHHRISDMRVQVSVRPDFVTVFDLVVRPWMDFCRTWVFFSCLNFDFDLNSAKFTDGGDCCESNKWLEWVRVIR